MDTDRYGRTVARIFVDGEDVNAAQLRSGHAWLYRQYCKEGWVCGEWAGLETEARSSGAGLWADKNPPPGSGTVMKKGHQRRGSRNFCAKRFGCCFEGHRAGHRHR